MTSRKKQLEGTRIYYIRKNDGSERRVTVPASWKVTFGPIWTPTAGSSSGLKYALRFYEGAKEHQRMVICDVEEFRDMSIPVVEKRKQSKRETYWKRGEAGDKAVVAEAIIEDWVNPDEPARTPNEEFLTIEHKKS